MKIKNLLLAVAAIALFVSCENEDNNSDKGETPYRIKQLITDKEGVTNDTKSVFTYEGEKLVKLTAYRKNANGVWFENYKSEITYYADSTIETNYYKITAGWEAVDKTVFAVSNGLKMNVHYYVFYPEASTWIEYYYYTYDYSDGRNTSWICYHYNRGWSEEDSKGEYTYQNDQLTQYIYYDHTSSGWTPVYKELFTYEGKHFVNRTRYRMDEPENWVNYTKSDYSFTGDKVSQIKQSFWNSQDSIWISNDVDSLSYNSKGCLIQSVRDYYGVATTTYEYEAGTGNAAFFKLDPGALANGNPTLRSAPVKTDRKRF